MTNQLRKIFGGTRRFAGTKLSCNLALSPWIAFFYYGPQHWIFRAAHQAPTLAIDRWIPFQPGWTLVYQSVFILVPLALWLPANRQAAKNYAFALGAAFGCGAIVFWLYPTLSPRPLHSDSMLYRSLISGLDGPGNALPSMHAAMGLLVAVAVDRHLRRCGASVLWRAALAVWWIALLYSTLATRQHRVLDLVAGIALGLFLQSLFAIIIPIPAHDEPIAIPPPAEPAIP
jgi:hypothetical protein